MKRYFILSAILCLNYQLKIIEHSQETHVCISIVKGEHVLIELPGLVSDGMNLLYLFITVPTGDDNILALKQRELMLGIIRPFINLSLVIVQLSFHLQGYIKLFLHHIVLVSMSDGTGQVSLQYLNIRLLDSLQITFGDVILVKELIKRHRHFS